MRLHFTSSPSSSSSSPRRRQRRSQPLLSSIFVLFVIIITPTLFLVQVLALDKEFWKTKNIYGPVLVDRFALSQNSINTDECLNRARGGGKGGGEGEGSFEVKLDDYCGGTFRGLTSRLDYIVELGTHEYLISSHFIPSHLISISSHLHFISSHLISSHLISSHSHLTLRMRRHMDYAGC